MKWQLRRRQSERAMSKRALAGASGGGATTRMVSAGVGQRVLLATRMITTIVVRCAQHVLSGPLKDNTSLLPVHMVSTCGENV